MSQLSNPRMRFYRWCVKELLEKRASARWISSERLSEFVSPSFLKTDWSQFPKKEPRVWFHAASVGELESLWSVVEEWASGSGELILTVFSDSAIGAVQKLARELPERGARVIFAGYSPGEGDWEKALDQCECDLFVTAKYEAWPELWAALACKKIPLAIVNAKRRASLRVAKTMSRILGGGQPSIRFFVADAKDCPGLEEDFPKATVRVSGEPRWDRVYRRASAGNPRASQLARQARGLAKPWGVLGSVWEEDLKLWTKSLTEITGTIWIVPHKVDDSHVQAVLKILKSSVDPGGVVRTSGIAPTEPLNARFIVVDEMGFLMELYSQADWAYVGGGFGQGVHSTIEPALFGIPIACGPKKAETFSEISLLRESGQLCLIQNGAELANWAARLSHLSPTLRTQWSEQARFRLGASARISGELSQILSG